MTSPPGSGSLLSTAGSGSLQKRKATSVYNHNDEAKAMSSHIFSKLDGDHSGFLEAKEMHRLRELMLSVPASREAGLALRMESDRSAASSTEVIDAMMADIDADGDGNIDSQEWADFNQALYEVLGQRQYLRIARTWASNIQQVEKTTSGKKKSAPVGSLKGWVRVADGKEVKEEEMSESVSASAWRAKTLGHDSTKTLGRNNSEHLESMTASPISHHSGGHRPATGSQSARKAQKDYAEFQEEMRSTGKISSHASRGPSIKQTSHEASLAVAGASCAHREESPRATSPPKRAPSNPRQGSPSRVSSAARVRRPSSVGFTFEPGAHTLSETGTKTEPLSQWKREARVEKTEPTTKKRESSHPSRYLSEESGTKTEPLLEARAGKPVPPATKRESSHPNRHISEDSGSKTEPVSQWKRDARVEKPEPPANKRESAHRNKYSSQESGSKTEPVSQWKSGGASKTDATPTHVHDMHEFQFPGRPASRESELSHGMLISHLEPRKGHGHSEGESKGAAKKDLAKKDTQEFQFPGRSVSTEPELSHGQLIPHLEPKKAIRHAEGESKGAAHKDETPTHSLLIKEFQLSGRLESIEEPAPKKGSRGADLEPIKGDRRMEGEIKGRQRNEREGSKEHHSVELKPPGRGDHSAERDSKDSHRRNERERSNDHYSTELKPPEMIDHIADDTLRPNERSRSKDRELKPPSREEQSKERRPPSTERESSRKGRRPSSRAPMSSTRNARERSTDRQTERQRSKSAEPKAPRRRDHSAERDPKGRNQSFERKPVKGTQSAELESTRHHRRVEADSEAEPKRVEQVARTEWNKLKAMDMRIEAQLNEDPGNSTEADKMKAELHGMHFPDADHAHQKGPSFTKQAATMIQSIHRGRLARREVENQKKREKTDKSKKPKKKEIPLTNASELFGVLCTHDGRTSNVLDSDVFLDAFTKCRKTGLDSHFAKAVPQTYGDDELPEDIVTGQVAFLCRLIQEQPEVEFENDEEAVREHLALSGVSMDEDDVRAFAGQNGDLSLKQFKRLLKIISMLMRIDEVYIATHCMWVLTGHFEMTDVLVAMMLEDCAQKVVKSGRLTGTSSGPLARPRCPGGCGFAVTDCHPTHCCKRCAKFGGSKNGHSGKCDQMTYREACTCGTVWMKDELHCRQCGHRRPRTQGAKEALPDLSSYTCEDKARLLKIQARTRGFLVRVRNSREGSIEEKPKDLAQVIDAVRAAGFSDNKPVLPFQKELPTAQENKTGVSTERTSTIEAPEGKGDSCSSSESENSSHCSDDLPDMMLLKEKFTLNDLSRMSYHSGIVDPREKTGLPFMIIGQVFGSVCVHIPDRLAERAKHVRHTWKHNEHHVIRDKHYLKGRTQFSILMEALWEAFPKAQNVRSPLQLCLRMLHSAKTEP